MPTNENTANLNPNYMVLKECNTSVNKQTQKGKQNEFEDVLYFVCNLCPFLCTKDTKITEHIENAHKNKRTRKLVQLKCPACSNIFYHKMSLRSHLIHDHGVGNSDLSIIIQAVVYYSNKNNNNNNSNNKTEEIASNSTNKHTGTKNVAPLKTDLTPLKNIPSIENSSNDTDGFDITTIEESQPTRLLDLAVETKIVNLPQMDLIGNSGEKFLNNLLKPLETPFYIPRGIEAKKNHKCSMSSCKVRLEDLNKLEYHQASHTKEGFMCLECSELFAFWKPLTSHLWRVHKIDMELYSCDKCDYKTFSLSKLNNIHKLIHGDVKAFVCDICQKAFKNTKQLRNHKITHKQKTNKLLFICEICLKNFAYRRQLKVHMDVVHKKIKPYLCNYCGYKGSSRSSLKMHIRQHTGERPFACDTCPYTTSDHNSLRRHKLRHTGHKPYKCPHCSYACIQSSTYKVHLKTKHPGLEKDLMFTCDICQFRSVNKDIFTSHMVTVHKQSPQEVQNQSNS